MSVPQFIAIDGSGDAWAQNYASNSVTEFNNSGTILSGVNGFASGGSLSV